MYHVYYNGSLVSSFDVEDPAIALAFNIHSSSNVKHSITVYCDSDLIVSINRISKRDDSVVSVDPVSSN